jgi:aryl-alcohol dehydrogenase-like predicted oxidoreductase
MKHGTMAGSEKAISRLVCGCDRLVAHGASHLDAAFARGINAFDTARIYWRSERVLGEWMHALGMREEVFLITKGGHPVDRHPPVNLREQILRDLERSFHDLRTDHIDLYLLHYDVPTVPAEIIVEILTEIKATNRVGAVGGANFTAERVKDIKAAAEASGGAKFAAVSVQLSLPTLVAPMWPWPGSVSIGGDEQSAERDWYESEGMPVFAYSCLGRGFFSRAYRTSRERIAHVAARPGVHGDVTWLESVLGSRDNVEKHRRAAELAERLNLTAAQVGLAYVLAKGPRIFAVAGWSDAATCDLNVAAVDVSLEEREIAWLDLRTPKNDVPWSTV